MTAPLEYPAAGTFGADDWCTDSPSVQCFVRESIHPAPVHLAFLPLPRRTRNSLKTLQGVLFFRGPPHRSQASQSLNLQSTCADCRSTQALADLSVVAVTILESVEPLSINEVRPKCPNVSVPIRVAICSKSVLLRAIPGRSTQIRRHPRHFMHYTSMRHAQLFILLDLNNGPTSMEASYSNLLRIFLCGILYHSPSNTDPSACFIVPSPCLRSSFHSPTY
jgi:hypothetical protein